MHEDKKEAEPVMETMSADLKMRINNFLWMELPSGMTLRQADNLACDIFRQIRTAWERADECAR